MKIFSTAALLCAVSFIPLHASVTDGNTHGLIQESTRNSRCIRVITEIPVGMLGSDVSHQSMASRCVRCEHACLPSASESCPSKKAGSQSLIESLLASSGGKCSTETPFAASVLQLLIELTKNLKVAPPEGDPENGPTFGAGATGGGRVAPHELTKAVETARDVAKTANEAATKAREAANADNLKTEEKNRRIAIAKAAEEIAKNALKDVDTASKAALAEGQPAFLLEEPTLTRPEKVVYDRKQAFFNADGRKVEKIKMLQDVVNFEWPSLRDKDSLSDTARASALLKALRKIGAPYPKITEYLPELTGMPSLTKIMILSVAAMA